MEGVSAVVPSRPERILVVEDDPNVGEVVSRYLSREGFEAPVTRDGLEALEIISRDGADLVILDLMIPGLDGLEVATRMRAIGDSTPIIILTARQRESDVVLGLGLGADDYIAKPFSPAELVARVKAVLRRRSATDITSGRVIRVGELTISPETRSVFCGEDRIELTSTEFDLAHFLASHLDQVFSREQLLKSVWDYSYVGDPSTVTVHVRRLRAKIERDPAIPKYIKTVWGVGYKFQSSDGILSGRL
jgi:DNA-binding response OmpR family regulator